MQPDRLQTAQDFARAKLVEWLGSDWNPPFSAVPPLGFHGTRKHWAESILEEGFAVPDKKSDGTAKRRKTGPAVYFFVETPRSLATGLSGVKAASIYASQKRGWTDPAVVVADLCVSQAVDMDAWQQWPVLFTKVMEAISRDGLTSDEMRAGHENAISMALTIVEDALNLKLEAILHWASDLPAPGCRGYHTLAVRPPVGLRLGGLRMEGPEL